ncbi:MAG: hypothetical protein COA99_19395 [Moraxellaceae bacterium]|nr:MAG: hypothetical protein COA99_19395 [Moraxellaceae bacterium]
MIKRTLALTVAMLVTSQGVSAGEFHNGKQTAMGGVGVAGADFRNGALLNPALVGNYDAGDDFDFNFNVGAIASDADDLLENAEDFVDAMDVLDGGINLSQSDIDEVTALLAEMQGATVRLDLGGYLQASIPNKVVSATLFAGSSLQVGIITEINQADIDYLNSAVNNLTPINTDLLTSEITAVGATVIEFGVSLARSFKIHGMDILFGVSPKIQQVETIEYAINVADFDEDDFDADDYVNDDSNFNLDLGAHTEFDRKWKVGVVLKNMLKKNYSTVSGRDLLIEPRLTIGGAYYNSWVVAELDLDLNATEDLVSDDKLQLMRLGAEFNAFDWAQLRVGYKMDLKSSVEDTVSVGFGLSPFGVANVDFAAVFGGDNTLGAALQLGFSF